MFRWDNFKGDCIKHLNICIRNHPQRERENVNYIVSDLFTDGLQLRDTGFKKAIRKGRDDRKPCVIIVTCKNIEDKTEIIRRKKQLRKNKHTRGYTSMQTSHWRHVLIITTLRHCYRLLVLKV